MRGTLLRLIGEPQTSTERHMRDHHSHAVSAPAEPGYPEHPETHERLGETPITVRMHIITG